MALSQACPSSLHAFYNLHTCGQCVPCVCAHLPPRPAICNPYRGHFSPAIRLLHLIPAHLCNIKPAQPAYHAEPALCAALWCRYDPENPPPPPDPERWLPKWQRSDAKKKHKKKHRGQEAIKGSQGAGKVDESLDRTHATGWGAGGA